MESGLAGRHGGRIGLAALVAILALGLGMRLAEAWDGREPVFDARAYAAIAANLDRGEGFTVGAAATQPSSNYSPGLPLLVAGVYAISGGVDERVARVVLALVGSLAILFAYLIARRLTRRAMSYPRQSAVKSSSGAASGTARDGRGEVLAGLLAAAIVAVFPALLEYQGMLMGEPLAATLLSGAVLAVLWAARPGDGEPVSALRPGGKQSDETPRGPEDGGPRTNTSPAGPPSSGPLRQGRWLLPGVLLGALAMVRPEYLGIAVLVAAVVFGARVPSEGWRRSGLAAALILLGVVVVVAPWTVRNAEALGRFVPISTGGGQVLFAGTYVPSGGDPERVGAEVVARHPGLFAPGDARRLRLEQILARLAAQRHPDMETDQALGQMGRERLWDELGSDPLGYAGFLGAKLARLVSPGPRAVMESPPWALLHWATLALALVGLGALALRRRWEAALLGTVLLAVVAVGLLGVASPRRVLVTVPLLAALAGSGALALASLHRRPGDAAPAPQSRS